MADICLHGATSNIQKVALIGQNKDVSQLHRKSLRPEVPISSAGLLDLVYFKAKQEAKDKSKLIVFSNGSTTQQFWTYVS